MIEISYSLGLLAAAVIFQAIVHYSLKRGRNQQQAQELHQRHLSNSSLLAPEESSLDGDEPPVFFELLSQTGSEMMMVRIKNTTAQYDRRKYNKSLTVIFLIYL